MNDLLLLGYLGKLPSKDSDKTVNMRKKGLFRNVTEIEGSCYSSRVLPRFYGKGWRMWSGTRRYHKNYYR